jgi:hypothetical protein
MDPSVVAGLGRGDAWDVASHEVDRGVVHPDEDDTSADGDAWADDVLEYVVVGVEDHASDAHASADDHTSDAVDGDVAVAVTFHLYHLDLDDAYDADQAEKLAVVDPN